MLNIKAVKASQARIVQEYRTQCEAIQQQDLETLEELEKEIAEEEAKLASNQLRLDTEKSALIAAEQHDRNEVTTLETEAEVLGKRRKELKVEYRKATEYIRLYGAGLVQFLDCNYKSQPGRVLCPEGKICASVKTSEEECDFWNCPGVLAAVANPNANGGTSSSVTATQLDTLLTTTATFANANNNVTVIHNGNGTTAL